MYERTLAEYEALARECPQVPEYRHSLTQLLTRVGDRHRDEGDLGAAASAYDRSLPLAEGLARDFPEAPSYRAGPIAVRTSLAKLAVKRRDAARARGLLERSLRELEAELKTNPEDDNARSYRITNLGYLARVQALEGDARAAGATADRFEKTARGPMELYNSGCYLSLLLKDVQDSATPGPDRDALRAPWPAGRWPSCARRRRRACKTWGRCWTIPTSTRFARGRSSRRCAAK